MKLRCRRCRRLTGEAAWVDRYEQAVVLDPAAEGTTRPGTRAVRWWDHMNARPPGRPRWRWDCGGKHRGSAGFITGDRLTSLYKAAARRGDDTIWLP